MKNNTRQCFCIPPSSLTEYGYVPSLVTENEPGHSPMAGEGKTPWYWGKTIERAEQICARVNQKRFGISPATANRIVASTMFEGETA